MDYQPPQTTWLRSLVEGVLGDAAGLARRNRWISASRGLTSLEHEADGSEYVGSFMMMMAQGIGKLDVAIMAMDQALISQLKIEELKTPLDHTIRSEELMTAFQLSTLWVMGAYELVRSVEDRIRKHQPFLEERLKSARRIKNELARLRIPLAKFEAKGRKNSAVASPIIHPELGTSWQIGPDDIVVRQVLADSVLEFLEGLGETTRV